MGILCQTQVKATLPRRDNVGVGHRLQKSSGYNQRSRVDTQMGRWKAVIAPKLKARQFDNQKTEAKIGVHVLNRMTELGRPECKRVA